MHIYFATQLAICQVKFVHSFLVDGISIALQITIYSFRRDVAKLHFESQISENSKKSVLTVCWLRGITLMRLPTIYSNQSADIQGRIRKTKMSTETTGLRLDIDTTPLWQQVADGVRRAIQTGELHPGDRVIESQLASSLGISRAPIREGLRQLQQKGILTYRANAGTIVAEPTVADAKIIFRTRLYIEVSAVEIIFEQSMQRELDCLNDVIDRMGDLAKSERAYIKSQQLDEEFHSSLVHACGIPVLRQVWDSVDPYTLMAMVRDKLGFDHDPGLDHFQAEHRGVLDALKSNDLTAACNAISSHIRCHKERWLDYVQHA